MLELSNTRRIGSPPDGAVGSFPLLGSGIYWIVGSDRWLLTFTFTGQRFGMNGRA